MNLLGNNEISGKKKKGEKKNPRGRIVVCGGWGREKREPVDGGSQWGERKSARNDLQAAVDKEWTGKGKVNLRKETLMVHIGVIGKGGDKTESYRLKAGKKNSLRSAWTRGPVGTQNPARERDLQRRLCEILGSAEPKKGKKTPGPSRVAKADWQ